MGNQEQDQPQTPTRRESEPTRHSYRHAQPKYPDPEYRPRRHTFENGGRLTKVHSRPEDYKNRPLPDKLVEYICFDKAGRPQECNDPDHNHDGADVEASKTEDKARLDRYQSNSSYGSSSDPRTEDDSGDEADYDSEDELTLPATYHHDVCHRDDEACDWFNANSHNKGKQSPERPHLKRQDAEVDIHPLAQHDLGRDHRQVADTYHHGDRDHRHDHQHHRHESDASSSSCSLRRRSHHHSQDISPHENDLLTQIAEHLQAHKDAYSHQGDSKAMVNELLAEVVRKVADGALDGKLMKEVVREVQHVL